MNRWIPPRDVRRATFWTGVGAFADVIAYRWARTGPWPAWGAFFLVALASIFPVATLRWALHDWFHGWAGAEEAPMPQVQQPDEIAVLTCLAARALLARGLRPDDPITPVALEADASCAAVIYARKGRDIELMPVPVA